MSDNVKSVEAFHVAKILPLTEKRRGNSRCQRGKLKICLRLHQWSRDPILQVLVARDDDFCMAKMLIFEKAKVIHNLLAQFSGMEVY